MGDTNSQSVNETNRENRIQSNGFTVDSFKKPSIAQVSILYSLAVIMFILLGNLIDKIHTGDFYLKGIISEVVLVLVPPLLMLLLFRYDFKKVLRLNKISFFNIFIIFCIMLFAIPAVSALNLVNILAIKYIFGKTLPNTMPGITTWVDLVKGIMVIGMSAAVCEEVLFRGTIQRGLERLGAVKSIILTSFLFGLMHQDFQKLLGTFLLGAIIGFIVYRTNSLYGGMVAHFTNNSLLVLLTFGMSKFNRFAESAGINGPGDYDSDKYLSELISGPTTELIGVLFVWGIIFLIFISAFIAAMYAFVVNTSDTAKSAVMERGQYKFARLLWLLPGIAFIGFLYFAQGLKLKEINIEAVTAILKMMGY
jgi:hypothetical protein